MLLLLLLLLFMLLFRFLFNRTFIHNHTCRERERGTGSVDLHDAYGVFCLLVVVCLVDFARFHAWQIYKQPVLLSRALLTCLVDPIRLIKKWLTAYAADQRTHNDTSTFNLLSLISLVVVVVAFDWCCHFSESAPLFVVVNRTFLSFYIHACIHPYTDLHACLSPCCFAGNLLFCNSLFSRRTNIFRDRGLIQKSFLFHFSKHTNTRALAQRKWKNRGGKERKVKKEKNF